MILSRREFVALTLGGLGGLQLGRLGGASSPGDASASPLPTPDQSTVEPVTTAPEVAPTDPGLSVPRSVPSPDVAEPTSIPVDPTPRPETTVSEDPTPRPAEPPLDLATGASLVLAGADMSTWETALGDSRFAAPGQDVVARTDITTEHSGDHTTLVSNVAGRGVMAHNTTYLRLVDQRALSTSHRARTEFRTPRTPERISGLPNGQTLEIALSVWDGENSRENRIVALQWVINPWSEDFGNLRTWTSDADGSHWTAEAVGWLEPSDSWQHVELSLDPTTEAASILLNGRPVPAEFVYTAKPANWAYRTAAAFAVELVSIWPGDRMQAPTTQAQCRNWQWEWLPVA